MTESSAYRREYIRPPDIKSERELEMFDCIAAPCIDACATNQDIPDYLWHTSQGDFDKAFEVILSDQPLPICNRHGMRSPVPEEVHQDKL
ncbi:MAG: hypothetical protein U5L72_12230 [Bacteroidales bacterium]|nr:hypothetical protein [Bacteroidales bacterium]